MEKVENYLTKLKARISRKTQDFEIWQFGSSIQKKSFNDIDLGIVLSSVNDINEVKKDLLSLNDTLVTLPKDYAKNPFSGYHIVILSTTQLKEEPIGKSIREGKIIHKSAA